MTQERIPFGPGVIILGGGALLLSAALFVGFLLPTDWEADASAIVPATRLGDALPSLRRRLI